ncbi:MAG: methylated-DNA--[protein]-cysteine S-methyltransferase [Candidatus Thorarchaeota archaeon]|jgi:O-6-methylguanine DNA methyltransferase
MTDRTLAVLKKNGLYTVGVFTPSGLYATSIPRESEIGAIKSVGGENLPRSSVKEHQRTLEIILAVYNGDENVPVDQVKLDFTGLTQKQVRVVEEALKIPRGTTITYGGLAKKAGLPNAARFVGNVMKSNRHYPLVPCHRVVSSSGLGGYGPGLEAKIAFLKREGAFAD